MTLPRKLQFKDRFVYHLTRQIEGDCEGEPILFPDDETPIKFVVEMSQNEFTSILSALMTGADLSYPENSHEVVWRLLRQVECPVSICDEILECLQPAFDEINDQLGEIQGTVDQIQQTQIDNATSETSLTQSSIENELCGAATFVVDAMHQTFVDTYEATEAAPLDNFAEFIVAFLRAIPIIAELPIDDMIAAVNWYFENQFLDFETDFDALRDQMICDLKCFVQANGNVFTWDIWAQWLQYTGDTYPDNRAAQGYARYSPYRQTWINQIAALINRDASLQSYFDGLGVAWESGLLQPAVCTCECSISWCKTFDFTIDAQGWELTPDGGNAYTPGVGWVGSSALGVRLQRAWSGAVQVTSVRFVTTGTPPVNHQTDITYPPGGSCFIQGGGDMTNDFTVDTTGSGCYAGIEYILAGVTIDGLAVYDGTLVLIELCGFGIEPDWD